MIKFPYGIADFRRIRREGRVYVDRTAHIRDVEDLGDVLVFLRPRRFGKSLWLSTLATYYDLRYGDEFDEQCLAESPRDVADHLLDFTEQGTVYPARDGYLLTARGNPYTNVVRDGNGVVVHTAGGKDLTLKPLKLIDLEDGLSTEGRVAMKSIAPHIEKMECYACHASWAPQCYGCHVKIDYSNGNTSYDWLAAGSKQVMLPVLFALPVYLWVADGWKAGWRYLKMVVGMGVVATALVAALTDVPAMLYQTLVVPSGHPIRGGVWLPGFVQVLRDFVPRASGFGVVIALYGLYRARCADGWVSLRQWARDNPWLVPVFVGVFLIPTSILGRMKVGGGMGALVYAVYFLFVGALLAVVHAGRQEDR